MAADGTQIGQVTPRVDGSDATGVSPSENGAGQLGGAPPPVGDVDFGSLGRVTPISRVFGLDRGRCIDRYYIEGFLARYRADIRGRVLEVAENDYTTRFGGDRVTQSDILHVSAECSRATIVADLTQRGQFPREAFDCVILTQTLQHIYDVRAVPATLWDMLKPGGVVLATVPGISQISRYDMDRWGDSWRFTTDSLGRLFEEAFPSGAIEVESHGNVLVAAAFLHGLTVEDLQPNDLDHNDPDYQLLLTVRARKPGGAVI